jgi:translation initiation factor IF-3
MLNMKVGGPYSYDNLYWFRTQEINDFLELGKPFNLDILFAGRSQQLSEVVLLVLKQSFFGEQVQKRP